MRTESQNAPCGVRIVSPSEWELTPRRMEDYFLDHHLALCLPLPDECEWADWIACSRRELLNPDEGCQAFFLVGRGDDEVRGWVIAQMIAQVSGWVIAQMQDWRPFLRPFVTDLIVMPKWRSRGYGRFLLRRAENYLRSQGHKQVFLDCNDDLISWYARQGYEICAPPGTNDCRSMEDGLFRLKKVSDFP